MEYEDYPIHPYTTIEQRRIMHDLEQSKRDAIEQSDHLKTYYLNEIETEND